MDIFLPALLLVTALSVDSFVAGFAYGTGKLKIPFSSAVILNVICSGVLGIALLAGSAVQKVLPISVTKIICFLILFLLGFAKLFDSSIKACIRKQKDIHKKISFSILHLRFILNVYADPKAADFDDSHSLSAKEAVSLGTALSLDGLAVGIGAAMGNLNCALVVILSFITGMVAVLAGGLIGNHIAKKTSLDLSWLSGLLLLILAFQHL